MNKIEERLQLELKDPEIQINPHVLEIPEEIQKVTYGGSFWNPTEWNDEIGEIAAGVSPDENADGWFIFENTLHRCIKDGAPTLFYDEEFWSWKEN